MQWKPRFVFDGWVKVARQAEKDGIIRGDIRYDSNELDGRREKERREGTRVK
jgi:hypothetical protein